MPSSGIVVLLLSGVLSSACVLTPRNGDAEAEPGAVKFDLVGPGDAALVVPVMVNGTGPYPFVLDTGATVTCVDAVMASELQLREVPGVVGTAGSLGGASRMQLLMLDSVSVGDATVRDLHGCTLDLTPMQEAGLKVRGLLGLNFLKNYRLTVDFDRQIVRLDRQPSS